MPTGARGELRESSAPASIARLLEWFRPRRSRLAGSEPRAREREQTPSGTAALYELEVAQVPVAPMHFGFASGDAAAPAIAAAALVNGALFRLIDRFRSESTSATDRRSPGVVGAPRSSLDGFKLVRFARRSGRGAPTPLRRDSVRPRPS